MGSCQQMPPPGLGPHIVPDVHGPPWSTGGCVAAARGAVVPPGLWRGWKWLRVECACMGDVGTVPFVLGVAAGPTWAGSALWGPMRGHWGLGGGAQSRVSQAWPQALHCMLYSLALVVAHCWVGKKRAVKEHADNLQSINTSPYLHSQVSSS